VLLEVDEARGSQDDLQQASVDVEGHALALILLATYLKNRFDGDITRRGEALLYDKHEHFSLHASKVMASYVAWFLRTDDPSRRAVGQAAVAILRLMGLFNRVADSGCVGALRSSPPIRDLTEPLFITTGMIGFRKHLPNDQVWEDAVLML
jgi:hypothetical protein